MALREVVDNCGDGSRAANPVLRMIDAFTGDKAAFHVRNHIHRRSRYYSHKETLYELWDESKFQVREMCLQMEVAAICGDIDKHVDCCDASLSRTSGWRREYRHK